MITVEFIAGSGTLFQTQYLLQDDKSLIYASPQFLNLIANYLNASPGWIVAKREDKVVGMLPYICKQGPLGCVYNSLAYYGSNGGVIQGQKDDDAKKALIKAFYDKAESENACSATLITNPLEMDADFYNSNIAYNFRDERISQITHFPVIDEVDDLIFSFDKPRPQNIRRAIKEGVNVNKSNTKSAINFLSQTHVDNMQAIDGLAKSEIFFKNIETFLKYDNWSIFISSINEEPVAALLLLYFNKTVEYFTPVIVQKYRNTQALALAIYVAMQDAIRMGYVNWNWGGTWLTQGGVYDFKKRWGTSEYRYFYYTKIYNDTLMNCSSKYLIEEYPGFFLIPFPELAKG